MGLVSSRLNLESLNTGRRRSQQDETLYSYSLNKNYFSNYFLMGGERFEVNDPDYLFGDNCDLNFLSCTKPCSLPYKQAQQNLLSNLSTKQKAINKASSRVDRFSSPLSIFYGHRRQTLGSRKQDSQAQSLHGSKSLSKGSESSQPLVMLINIRKETLRLVKASTISNQDSDLNSLTNSLSTSEQKTSTNHIRPARKHSLRQSKKSLSQQHPQSSNRHSATSSRATTSTIHPNEANCTTDEETGELATSNFSPRKLDSDVGSLVSATSSMRSGYASIKEDGPVDDSSDDDDENFEDALNDTTNISMNDDDSEKTQQQRCLLLSETKDNRDIKITIEPSASISAGTASDIKMNSSMDNKENIENLQKLHGHSSLSIQPSSTKRLSKIKATDGSHTEKETVDTSRAYNIEFIFDADVDCSIRVFYFCTREITSTGINYKPQHASYKSKIYYYKKGLNQKFDQPEHTFQPYLFDEDVLIYKPLDLEGNYNSGAVFPIVIQCIALEGPTPKQSQSLVATIEKSQLDDSYSIKSIKQLIFVDGVQYILQDIYGIENKPFSAGKTRGASAEAGSTRTLKLTGSSNGIRDKAHSLQSSLNGSHLNLSDTASVASADFSISSRQNRGSVISSNRLKTNDNSFECVICMSEERDTMLLPCRHLCLCSACAQSLRYQASSCPICRCPFKAALNLRPIQKLCPTSQSTSTATKTIDASSNPTVSTSLSTNKVKKTPTGEGDSVEREKDSHPRLIKRDNQAPTILNNDNKATVDDNFGDISANRRESITTSATPLLSAPLDVVVNLDSDGRNSSVTTIAATPAASYLRPSSCGFGSSNQAKLNLKSESSSAIVADDKCQMQGLGGESGSLELSTMNAQWRPSNEQE